jgi:hypothetical protein
MQRSMGQLAGRLAGVDHSAMAAFNKPSSHQPTCCKYLLMIVQLRSVRSAEECISGLCFSGCYEWRTQCIRSAFNMAYSAACGSWLDGLPEVNLQIVTCSKPPSHQPHLLQLLVK